MITWEVCMIYSDYKTFKKGSPEFYKRLLIFIFNFLRQLNVEIFNKFSIYI